MLFDPHLLQARQKNFEPAQTPRNWPFFMGIVLETAAVERAFMVLEDGADYSNAKFENRTLSLQNPILEL
jgi:hypothetical protein